MFQALFDKFADWLLPFFIGLAVWYGFHYFVLTPRIIQVDQKELYAVAHIKNTLPGEVQACIRRKIVPATLDHARIEAAFYTASIKNITAPYRNKLSEIEALINEQCGVSKVIAKQEKQQNMIDARDHVVNELKHWYQMLQEFSK